MDDTKNTTQTEDTTVAQAPVATVPALDSKDPSKKRSVSFVGREGNRERKPRRDRNAGSGSEPEQKIIDIRRVTRVVAGGRRFSFSVALVVGDKNGRVGVGLGKGSDTAIAIDKALKQGKKAMIKIPFTKNRSIKREVEAKYCSARVYIQPAKGKGLVAGSSLRNVLDLAGITDVNAKILSRSKNKLNIARAAIEALKQVK